MEKGSRPGVVGLHDRAIHGIVMERALRGEVYLGVDVGSTTTKVVVVGEDRSLIESRYVRSCGKPRQTLLETIAGLPDVRIRGIGLTGSGGGPIAALVGGLPVNELVAQSRSVGAFHKEARTVIEIGGQDSKLLSLQWDEHSRQMVLIDFAMNALCAAGTGSFLDQQAERLGISIENDFARIALASTTPARIAGRCTVFAKSDMIHLQQLGTPLSDILAGLCLALARNFKTVIGKGMVFAPPVLFQGGVAYNRAVVKAFEEVLGLGAGELIVPRHHGLMAAIGAALEVIDEEEDGRTYPFDGFEPLAESLRSPHAEGSLAVLVPPLLEAPGPNGARSRRPVGEIRAYLGVDVGSISTCLALVDEQNAVRSERYLMTAGQPLEAVRSGLADLEREFAGRIEILGVGVTGSGRYLTGDFIGADVVRNEITAQAKAAVLLDPEVDTILEIGGQDSKYIRLNRGAVVDFTMNNACAAGTGSFLEEQADKLRISVSEEFSRLAFRAGRPACLGERCTVFMESDLVHHQQQGSSLEDLTAGLAYSIVNNYMNRVVNGREIGRRILFQGGVASNRSVAAAFAQVLGRPVRVPPHNRTTGAIGAAILAREYMEEARTGRRSRFKGFSLARARYEATMFVCRACPNLCEIKKVTVDGGAPAFYGARCDKFEEAGRARRTGDALPDLFAERERLLLDGWSPPGPRTNGRARIGMPMALAFYDLFPYWRALFDALGMEIVLSDPTSPRIVHDTQHHAQADSCFPVKLVYGHALNVARKDVDFVFLPSIADRESASPGQVYSNYCPLIPASSQMVKAQLDLDALGVRALHASMYLSKPKSVRHGLADLARQLGCPVRRAVQAGEVASKALDRFYERASRRGREVLDGLDPGQPAVVIVGRPYNTCDAGACMNLPAQVRKLGALPIPIDFLPVRGQNITDEHPTMYWRSGQDILAAAKLVREDARLHAIYVTNFDCGPDSFLLSFFRRMMGPKPFLELEIDDHTAEAGVITRCEAFLDSLNLTAGVRG